MPRFKWMPIMLPGSPGKVDTYDLMRLQVYGPVHVVAPMPMFIEHAEQAFINHGDVTRLAERGGVTACEAMAILEDRQWRAMPPSEAYRRLHDFITGWLSKHPSWELEIDNEGKVI